jgi:hypothetical protein
MHFDDKKILVELTNSLTVAYPTTHIHSAALQQTLKQGYHMSYRGSFGSIWVNEDKANMPDNKTQFTEAIKNTPELLAALQSGTATVNQVAKIISTTVETARRLLALGHSLKLWTINIDVFVTRLIIT